MSPEVRGQSGEVRRRSRAADDMSKEIQKQREREREEGTAGREKETWSE